MEGDFSAPALGLVFNVERSPSENSVVSSNEGQNQDTNVNNNSSSLTPENAQYRPDKEIKIEEPDYNSDDQFDNPFSIQFGFNNMQTSDRPIWSNLNFDMTDATQNLIGAQNPSNYPYMNIFGDLSSTPLSTSPGPFGSAENAPFSSFSALINNRANLNNQYPAANTENMSSSISSTQNTYRTATPYASDMFQWGPWSELPNKGTFPNGSTWNPYPGPTNGNLPTAAPPSYYANPFAETAQPAAKPTEYMPSHNNHAHGHCHTHAPCQHSHGAPERASRCAHGAPQVAGCVYRGWQDPTHSPTPSHRHGHCCAPPQCHCAHATGCNKQMFHSHAGHAVKQCCHCCH